MSTEEPDVAAFEYAYDTVADLDNAVAERHYCYLPAVRAGLAAARPIIEAEVRERCGPDHVLGQPCHHLYGRCFPTDASLLEYRVRQREHGAHKERERIAAEIEANCRHMNHENRRLCHRCVAAARIARNGG